MFERILKEKCEKYESFGGYILEVEGINFKEYYSVLTKLGIKVIVKTDNDLQKIKGKSECNKIGINRCLRLIDQEEKPSLNINVSKYDQDAAYIVELKKEMFSKIPKTINMLKKRYIFLSRVDLENDLYEAIPKIMDKLSKDNNSSKNGIDYLQSAKLINMIELSTTLTNYAINKIYKHERFECLKALVELCCR